MNDKLLKRARNILEAAEHSAVTNEGRYRIEEMQVYVGYAEPGYGTLEGDDVIVTGNFNAITRHDSRNGQYHSVVMDDIAARAGKVLEKAGIAIEWNDEWTDCSGCNRLVRISADSYSWTPSYVMGDCEVICAECVEEDPEEHLESLEGCPDKANTLAGIHPEEHGYICLGEFERGYHPGQDDDPKLVAKALGDLGLERWLFNIDNVGQFDTRFSVWLHEDELKEHGINQEELESLLERKAVGASVSEALKRAFDDASRKMGELPGEGVKYAKLNEDGTADVKIVSQEDFIKGKL